VESIYQCQLGVATYNSFLAYSAGFGKSDATWPPTTFRAPKPRPAINPKPLTKDEARRIAVNIAGGLRAGGGIPPSGTSNSQFATGKDVE
jgi:hypothetical protein